MLKAYVIVVETEMNHSSSVIIKVFSQNIALNRTEYDERIHDGNGEERGFQMLMFLFSMPRR